MEECVMSVKLLHIAVVAVVVAAVVTYDNFDHEKTI
jgi:hypothetical protein